MAGEEHREVEALHALRPRVPIRVQVVALDESRIRVQEEHQGVRGAPAIVQVDLLVERVLEGLGIQGPRVETGALKAPHLPDREPGDLLVAAHQAHIDTSGRGLHNEQRSTGVREVFGVGGIEHGDGMVSGMRRARVETVVEATNFI